MTAHSHPIVIAQTVAGVCCLAGQREVGDGCKRAWQFKLGGIVGVGAGSLRYHKVSHVEVCLDGTGRPHADDCLHAVEVEEFVSVDADGGIVSMRGLSLSPPW